jgi:hypothetical protein
MSSADKNKRKKASGGGNGGTADGISPLTEVQLVLLLDEVHAPHSTGPLLRLAESGRLVQTCCRREGTLGPEDDLRVPAVLAKGDGLAQQPLCALDEGGSRLWCGSMPENADRLWSAMLLKASKYKKLANKTGLPYVMIVHGLFTSCLDSGEVEKCILPSDGLFAEYSQLSGVYHMYERTYKGRLQLHWDGEKLNATAEAGDVAHAVLFFACEESSYISGQTLPITGGWF